MNMGHGPGLLALVLKLYLVLLLVGGVLAQNHTGHPPSSGPSSSSSVFQSSGSNSSSLPVSPSAFSSAQSSSSSTSHSHKSSSSTSTSTGLASSTDSASTDSDTTTSSSAFTSDNANPPDPTNTPPLPDSTTSFDGLTSSDGATSAVSSSTAIAAFSSSHSNNHVPIIAGVIAPVCLIILAAVAFMLYKRRQRAQDRREWERTHEAIADAVRQVGSPVPRSVAPYAGSGTWSHLTSAKGSGDTVTNPFTDEPVAHQSAEQSAALPFRPVRSPTLRSTHSPAFSQTYPPFNVQDDAQSRQSTTDSSVHFQSHPDGHAI